MKRLRLALAQINPTVGDIAGNAAKILERYRLACRAFRPDLVVFPECALVGYPPEDLLLRPSFVSANLAALKDLARGAGQAPMVVGFVDRRGNALHNAAAVLSHGRVSHVYAKRFLPNYGVFDEKRYFQSGRASGLIRVNGIKVGLSICEDIWLEKDWAQFGTRSVRVESPAIEQARWGAKVLVNISASPFHAGKLGVRERVVQKLARRAKAGVAYVNLTGGQDELVFDGRSMAADSRGRISAVAESFGEDLRCVEFVVSNGNVSAVPLDGRGRETGSKGLEEIYQALVLGTRDYALKNGFKEALIGLSGGIDSALTACIAVDALGTDRVTGVTMPSRYSSSATRSDAEKSAKNLGIRFKTIPIEPLFKAHFKALAPSFKGLKPGLAEENLQSRIRGVTLMALSNKLGAVVLTTGNKSETSVGYCTLYGDTAGGLAVLKDVPKTVVYALSRYVNQKAGRAVIPLSTIRRAPTAELRHNQKDQDSLPPYEVLDRIIKAYVEEDRGWKELLKLNIPAAILKKVLSLIDMNEYKRRQSPPGIRITPKSFGKDRRMPITNRFRER